MENLAVLGPEGTFSDSASKAYLTQNNLDLHRLYYPTVDDVFHAVGKTCGYGIVPVENTLDGYVQRSLDLLLEMDIHIIQEIAVPVQFSLIANTDRLQDINTLYVQFKTNGQCREFIDSLQNKKNYHHRKQHGILPPCTAGA